MLPSRSGSSAARPAPRPSVPVPERPRRERGTLVVAPAGYGESREGRPLGCFGEGDVLVVAGMHGDEPETTVVRVGRAARPAGPTRCAAPSCWRRTPTASSAARAATPRGSISTATSPPPTGARGRRSTAGSSTGRRTWSWTRAEGRDPSPRRPPSSSSSSASRRAPWWPCTRRCAAWTTPTPRRSGGGSPQRSGLPLVPDVGYPVPGSLGTWGRERGVPIVTYELPPVACRCSCATTGPWSPSCSPRRRAHGAPSRATLSRPDGGRDGQIEGALGLGHGNDVGDVALGEPGMGHQVLVRRLERAAPVERHAAHEGEVLAEEGDEGDRVAVVVRHPEGEDPPAEAHRLQGVGERAHLVPDRLDHHVGPVVGRGWRPSSRSAPRPPRRRRSPRPRRGGRSRPRPSRGRRRGP